MFSPLSLVCAHGPGGRITEHMFDVAQPGAERREVTPAGSQASASPVLGKYRRQLHHFVSWNSSWK
jgi:hypothetical protein